MVSIDSMPYVAGGNPCGPIELDPSAIVPHYAQGGVRRGLKAYRGRRSNARADNAARLRLVGGGYTPNCSDAFTSNPAPANAVDKACAPVPAVRCCILRLLIFRYRSRDWAWLRHQYRVKPVDAPPAGAVLRRHRPVGRA